MTKYAYIYTPEGYVYIKFNNTQVYNKADIFSNTNLNLWKKQMIILLMGDLHQ